VIALALGGGLIEVSAVYAAATAVGFIAGTVLLRRHIIRPRLTIQTARWWPIIKGAPRSAS
jgi:hypothetical protein